MQKVVIREEGICGSGQTPHCQSVQQQHGRSRFGGHACSALSHWTSPTSLASEHLVLLDWPITGQWLSPLPPSSHPEAGGEVYATSWLPCRCPHQGWQTGWLEPLEKRTTVNGRCSRTSSSCLTFTSTSEGHCSIGWCQTRPTRSFSHSCWKTWTMYKNGYTQMACLKCKVLLCFTKNKNCFLNFHTKKWHSDNEDLRCPCSIIGIMDQTYFSPYCPMQSYCSFLLLYSVNLPLRANVANWQHLRIHCVWRLI